MPPTLANAPTPKLIKSLKLRIERDPLQWFKPSSEEQLNVLRNHTKGTLALGGNRSGKTTIGGVRAVAKATGRTVCNWTPRKARRIWCVSQELPGASDRKSGDQERPHTQLSEIKRWMPIAALRGQSWSSAYSPGSYTLTLADKTKIEFKSYDQDPLSFESAAVDHIWFDEEPTRKSIFRSCLLRLVDRRGTWDMTLTPILSLEGKGAIAEALWDDRIEAEQRGEYRCFQLLTSNNIHLPQDEVRSLQSLPEEERQVRLYGAFARLGGRILNEFDAGRHVVSDFIPPSDWRHYLIIDPGWRTAAHLFAAVDRRGVVTLYAERYLHEVPISERMSLLHQDWKDFGQPNYDVIGDSAAFSRTRQGGTEKESPSDFDEYQAAADKLGARWFIPRKCIKADPQAYRVNRYLKANMLRVCKRMRWWMWEQERWVRQRPREGGLATERAIPEAPIQRYDHLLDCTRYLCNELPEPLMDAPPRNLLEDQSWLPEQLRSPATDFGNDPMQYPSDTPKMEVYW